MVHRSFVKNERGRRAQWGTGVLHRARLAMGNGRDIPSKILAGTSQDGAIEVEENRLAGKRSLYSLGQ
jgi:hypothetical protein